MKVWQINESIPPEILRDALMLAAEAVHRIDMSTCDPAYVPSVHEMVEKWITDSTPKPKPEV